MTEEPIRFTADELREKDRRMLWSILKEAADTHDITLQEAAEQILDAGFSRPSPCSDTVAMAAKRAGRWARDHTILSAEQIIALDLAIRDLAEE